MNRSIEEKRLCISFNCVSDILIIAHEREQNHSEFDVCFEIIIRAWYIKELIKALRQYIKHCSQCLTIQTRRHKFYENLQSIHSFFVSFHTIIVNFVLELSKIKEEMNCVLSITNKFTKRIMLISEKFIYTTEKWAIQLLKKSQRRNWNISKVIIFSLAVELGFGQKFKSDPRVDVRPGWTDQSSQLDLRVGVRRILSSPSDTSYI